MGWFSADVETNVKRGSVTSCSSVGIVPVTFKELWDNYEDGDPPYQVNGKPPKGFENQCAIRMSVTLHKLNVKMLTFSQKYISPEGKASTLGRIVLNGKPTATRASEMAKWLDTRPVCGIGAKQVITGANWKDKIKGKTGIIFFGEYWERDGESPDIASGGHIDLWNKNTLTPSLESFVRFTLGLDSATLLNMYNLGKAKRIWFYEVK